MTDIDKIKELALLTDDEIRAVLHEIQYCLAEYVSDDERAVAKAQVAKFLSIKLGEDRDCIDCNGKKIASYRNMGDGSVTHRSCIACNGTGKLPAVIPCRSCKDGRMSYWHEKLQKERHKKCINCGGTGYRPAKTIADVIREAL